MGDLVGLLERLNLSPVNTLLLGCILIFIVKLFKKFEVLEGEDGPLKGLDKRISDEVRCIDERLGEHEVKIAVTAQRISTLEKLEANRGDER